MPGNLSSESEQGDGAPWYENSYEVPDYAHGTVAGPVYPGYWYEHITPYQLLTHTAGVGMYLDNGGAATYLGIDPVTTAHDAIMYSLHHKKVWAKPGTKYGYSNYGFTILGELVTVASGTSLEQNIHDVVLDPLGLSMTTCYDAPHVSFDSVVHTFNGVTKEPQGTLKATCGSSFYPWLASSGWQSSAVDLVELMLATDRDPGHPDILAPATLDLMETPDAKFGSRALGWRAIEDGNGNYAYQHGGDWMTGTASIKKYPAETYDPGQPEMTVAVCTNGGNATSSALEAFTNALVEGIVSRAMIDPAYDLHGVY